MHLILCVCMCNYWHSGSGISRLERLVGPRICKCSVHSLVQQLQERKVSSVGGAQALLGPTVDTPLHSSTDQTTQESRLTRDVHAVWTKTSFDLGKNGGHTPCSLGGRSIVVVRQADNILAVYRILNLPTSILKQV